MKAVRTAALIVGAVALIATGVGAIGMFAASSALGAATVGGALSAGLGASVFGIASAGTLLLAAGALLTISGGMSKKPKGIAGGSQTEFSADPRAGVPYAMGRTGTKGNIVFHRSADGWSNDTPRDLKDFVTILSGGGPITEIESFTSDKTAVTFDGSGNATGNLSGYMFQKRQLGACPEASRLTVAAGISAAPTGWTTDHKLSGLAAVIWRLRFDAEQKFYQGGVPEPMWVIKGVKVYDPRQDDTYPGGSGDCRWDDESTWVWDGVDPSYPAGRNPYLQALTWCIGRHQNGKRVMGLGATFDQIKVDQYVEGANVCDANGWTISGVIYSRPDTKWNNLKLILQAGGGEPLRVGAQIGCRVETPRVSLATITRDDIVGDAQLATTQSRRARINTVIPRGRSETNEWEVVPHAAIAVAAHVTEDGGERTRELEWPLVDDEEQLAQLARYEIENSREFGPGTFPLKPLFLGYKAGDCLTLDIDDVEDQKILLLGRDIDPSGGAVTMTVRSETDGKHAFALGETGTPPATASVSAYDPTVAAPAAADWTLTGSQLFANNTAIPALVATGACSNGYADAIIWEHRVYDSGAGDEDNWIAAGVDTPGIVRKEVTGVTPRTEYEVSVRYRARGVIGARRILGPVTVGEWGSGVRYLRSKTVNYPLSSDDNSIDNAAFDGVTNNGLAISFPSGSITSLSSGTVYAVLWDIEDEIYLAAVEPASAYMASPEYVFLGWQATSTAGVFDDPEPAPPGYCVTIDTPVLLTAGNEVPAGDLVVGDRLHTYHEYTKAEGDWPIIAITFQEGQPVFACELVGENGPVTIRATANHRFLIGNRWVCACDVGEPDGTATVAKITVAEAHTYLSNGVISHNAKAGYGSL